MILFVTKPPLLRYGLPATIRSASAFPIPGRVFNWARLALLMSIRAGRAALCCAGGAASRLPWPADTPPASDNVTNAISTVSLARVCTIDYFACMTLISAMRPVSWQIMQVSVVASAVLRGW